VCVCVCVCVFILLEEAGDEVGGDGVEEGAVGLPRGEHAYDGPACGCVCVCVWVCGWMGGWV
jgi:hypothetical protein